MKRFLLSIMLVMLAFSFRVSAENNVYNWTVDGSESQITAGIKYLALGDVVWGVDWHSAGQNDGKVKGSDCIVFGAYNNPLRNLTFSSKAFAGKTIVSISICANRPEKATTTFVAKIDGEPVGDAKELAAGTTTEGFTDCSFDNLNIEVPSKGKVELAFVNTNDKTGINSGNGGFNIRSITIEYIGSKITQQPIPQKAVLKFAEDSHSIEVGETSGSPELTKETDGDITYTSSNPEVATVDTKSGKVTGVSAGTAIITATSEETVAYQEGAASYSLTVIEPDPEPVDPSGIPAVFNFAEPSSLHHTSPLSDKIPDGNTGHYYYKVNDISFTSGPVILTGTGKGDVRLFCTVSNPTPDSDGEAWSYRLLRQTELTIKCSSENNHLVSVVFNPSNEKYAQNFDRLIQNNDIFSTGEYDAETQTLNMGTDKTNVTITVTGTSLGFSSITAYYTSSSTDINDISTDNDDSTVEYYNLQGVHVTTPTPGLYIRVQGKQATKVYLK